jgi:hypothetical protein
MPAESSTEHVKGFSALKIPIHVEGAIRAMYKLLWTVSGLNTDKENYSPYARDL